MNTPEQEPGIEPGESEVATNDQDSRAHDSSDDSAQSQAQVTPEQKQDSGTDVPSKDGNLIGKINNMLTTDWTTIEGGVVFILLGERRPR